MPHLNIAQNLIFKMILCCRMIVGVGGNSKEFITTIASCYNILVSYLLQFVQVSS